MSEQATYTEHIYQEYHYKDFEPIHQREEIVRCRDCKYSDAIRTRYRQETVYACLNFDSAAIEPDGYCAWGERIRL